MNTFSSVLSGFWGILSPLFKKKSITKTPRIKKNSAVPIHCNPIVPSSSILGGNNSKETREAVKAKSTDLEEARRLRDQKEQQKTASN